MFIFDIPNGHYDQAIILSAGGKYVYRQTCPSCNSQFLRYAD
ncbi:MAG: hypothetical protein RBU23_00045 [Candidatus Auribacterota bacterium]|nr:hypothetical protein [Candidatus Auribacterota bacterium]